MVNKTLFGIIGLLMTAIAAVGVVQINNQREAVASESASVRENIVPIADTNITTQSASVAAADDDDSEGELDDDPRTTTAKPAVPMSVTTTKPTVPGTYTMAQIAIHNSAQSCYSTISGLVYDVTPFISQHPGGSAKILSLCGKDGTAAFTDQHSGQPRPATELASLKIGTLAK